MSYLSLNIHNSYLAKKEDVILGFYEPVLKETKQYDRIAGFFTSSTLAVAARGLAGFIANQGRMRLLCSPILSKEDSILLKRIGENDPTLDLSDFNIDLGKIEDEFESNHVKALGWLLKEGFLDIRLAIVVDDCGKAMTKHEIEESGLFHMKVGIMTDIEGNRLSYSGSINETASAWTENCEQFKVFREWIAPDYFIDDQTSFEELWNGKVKDILIYDIPEAVAQSLIKYSADFDVDSISKSKYLSRRKQLERISLFPYQKEAVEKWKKCNYQMLFEMATGTGKTRTAIAAIQYLMHVEERLIVIVSCPQTTLSEQWRSEIRKLGLQFDENHIIDGTNSNWKDDLSICLSSHNIGDANHCIFFTTHDTSSSETFLSIVNRRLRPNAKVLFVGDEVHWLGAREYRKALQERYQYRIGLSATPSRWFDDQGTKLLKNFFGNNSFEFSIKQALTTINPLTGKHFLVDYYYRLLSANLNEEESDKYREYTVKMAKLYAVRQDNPDSEDAYEACARARAKIVQNAESKYDILRTILDELKLKGRVQDLIIFVSPEQKEMVKEILIEKGIIAHQLTQEEKTKREKQYGNISERDYIIKLFKEKTYQAIVAIKCLDEGIDIPSASIGILMASSTNPREYIQRIGRIIRQDEGKSFATLYDIYVSEADGLPQDAQIVEESLRRKEKQRLIEIAENARNFGAVMAIIQTL